MFYWLFTLVFFTCALVLISIFNYFEKRKLVEKNLERIRNKWGRPVNSRRNFKMIAAYLHGIEDPARVSTAMADDLDLNNIFNFIDRTNSKPGKQYLYKKLFTPETSFENLLKFDKKVEALNLPRPDLELMELDIAQLNSTDSYYLADLFLREHEPVLAPAIGVYVRISGVAIIGLLISLFIVPNPVSFIVLVLLIGGNIALHFGTRNKISAYTRSLPQLMILHGVARKLLKKVKSEQEELIKQSLSKLSGLHRALRLVNFESKLAGNPENLAYAIYKFFKVLFLLEPLMFFTSVRRINKYRADIEVIFNFVAETDTLISVLSLRAGLPHYSKPVFYTESLYR